jgi:hypothetical protein
MAIIELMTFPASDLYKSEPKGSIFSPIASILLAEKGVIRYEIVINKLTYSAKF